MKSYRISVVNQNNQIKSDKLGQLFRRFIKIMKLQRHWRWLGIGEKDLVALSKGTIFSKIHLKMIKYSLTSHYP
jgi:hypothetical protein